jgi:hypothetical protein
MESFTLTKKQYIYYSYTVLLFQILYFSLLIGFSFVDIQYVRFVIVLVHVVICLFLLLKFNRFINKPVDINIYEKKFIFGGALILLINIFIYEFGVITFLQNQNLKPAIEGWVEKIKDFLLGEVGFQ